MKKDRNLMITFLFIVLAILLVAYFTFQKDDTRHYHWAETYKVTSNQPYGTLFIQKLLASYRPGQTFTINDKKPLHKLLDSTDIKANTDYVLIGHEIFLDDADEKALLNFISSGNNAFIATTNLPFAVVDRMFVSECERDIFLMKDDTLSVNLNFYNSTLKTEKGYTYAYRYLKKDVPYFWNTLNPEVFCDSTTSIVPLGYIHSEKVNFFRLQYGKGNLYIHTNPLVFTNYFLTKAEKAEYASSVFSHLKGKAIIWDEFSKAAFIPKNNAPEISPVSYILEQESLRYAWWLILLSALLYTLFTAKRKQRPIPVLEEKANTSLEFVSMISTLHFQNANHHDIAKKKMRYFFYFIRAKYGVHTQTLSEGILKRLADKSKVEFASLQAIANEFHHIEHRPYYNEPRLVDLYNALEQFYKHCK